MKQGKAYTLNFRRKRAGKTNYKSRLKLLSSGSLRAVLRRRLNNFTVQIVRYESAGDKTVVSSNTRELLKYGWKGHRGNISSAYLAGLLCGLKAKKKGVTSGVVDLGVYRAVLGSSFFAAAKGLIDSGFKISVGESVLPSDDRISGKHIQDYASKIKGKDSYNKQFSSYIKSGLKPEEITKHFEEVKKKILEKW